MSDTKPIMLEVDPFQAEDAKDAAMTDEQIAQIIKAHLTYSSGGCAQSTDYSHYFGDMSELITMARAILSAQPEVKPLHAEDAKDAERLSFLIAEAYNMHSGRFNFKEDVALVISIRVENPRAAIDAAIQAQRGKQR